MSDQAYNIGNLRNAKWEYWLFSLSIAKALLLLSVVGIEYPSFPNDHIVEKAHYFAIASSIFIFYTAFFLYFFANRLTFDKVDIMLIVFALYIVVNCYVRNLYFTENISSFVLAILSVLVIKQLAYSRYGYVMVSVCTCAIPIIGIYEATYGQLQIWGILKSNHSLFRITGSFHNPGPYAIYISSILVFSTARLLFPQQISVSSPLGKAVSPQIKSIYGVSCTLITMVLPATQSRTAWIAASIGILFLLFFKYREIVFQKWSALRNNYRRLLFISSGLTLVLISLSLLYNLKPASVNGRWNIWKITLEAIQKNILFGIGHDQFPLQFGNFQYNYFNKYFSTALPDVNSEFVSYVFNDYLQLWAENGLVGLGVFVSVVYFCIRQVNRVAKDAEAIVIGSCGGLLAILISALSSYPFELIPIWFLLLLFIGFVSIPSNKFVSVDIVKNGYAKCALVLTLTLSVAVFIREVDLWQGRVLWEKAKKRYAEGIYGEAVDVYKLATIKLRNRPDILPDYGKSLFMNKDYAASCRVLKIASMQVFNPIVLTNLGDAYTALKSLKSAENVYVKAIKMAPDRMYPRYQLATFYLKSGDSTRALKEAKYISEMPVRITSRATAEMQRHMITLLND